MTKTIKYELYDIGDILKIPVSRMDAFTAELKQWRELHEVNTQAISLEPVTTIEKMTWIDDGLTNVRENYYVRDDEDRQLDLGTIDLKK